MRRTAHGSGRSAVIEPYHNLHLVHDVNVGGLQMMVYRLLEKLDPRRFRATVCCFDERGSLAEDFERAGIRVLFLPRRPGVDYRYPFRLASLFSELRVDLAHLHTEDGFIYGVLGAYMARIPGIVYTEHGRD